MILNTTTSWTADKVRCKEDDDLDCTIESYIAVPLSPKEKHQSPQWNFAQTYRHDTGLLDRKALNEAFYEIPFLVLDYDNNTDLKLFTIEDFEYLFSEYKYMLYTTISHTIDIPHFRAILTLDAPVPRDNLKAFKMAKRYVELFPFADEASFEISRWFIIPQSGPGRFYEYRFHDGKKYPHNNLMEPVAKKVINKDNTIKHPELYLKKALPVIIESIKAFDINNRGKSRKSNVEIFKFYKELYRLYEKCGDSDPDTKAKNLLLSYATNPVTISDIKNKKI